jgi:uncharacterized protein
VINWLLYAILRSQSDLAVLAAVVIVQALGAWILWRRTGSVRVRRAIVAGVLFSYGLLFTGFLLGFNRFRILAPDWADWGRGFAIAWGFVSVLMIVALVASRWFKIRKEYSAPRRTFLRTAQAALFCGPAAAMGYGVFIQRFDFRIREQDLMFPDLPHGLDGLRIAQLTDIHLSPFLSERDLARTIDMANETRPHITLVTGDLITSAGDPLDACLSQLARLRADAGVFGCMGNHETYADVEDYVERQAARFGAQFLRSRAVQLRFGGGTLNLAGVDYQRKNRPYLKTAEKLVIPGTFNMLLSHNPDVFPVAAQQGYQATISGHTHGGQVRVEILREDLNIARFFTPYVDGLYRKDGSAIFVSRGIGTIGLPARLGAPPEVALLRLCRS